MVVRMTKGSQKFPFENCQAQHHHKTLESHGRKMILTKNVWEKDVWGARDPQRIVFGLGLSLDSDLVR